MALKRNHHEIAKLIKMFDMIKQNMLNADFSVLWRKFINDYDAVISEEKSAEEILFEMQMEEGVRKLDRAEGKEFEIDDTLMRHAERDNLIEIRCNHNHFVLF